MTYLESYDYYPTALSVEVLLKSAKFWPANKKDLAAQEFARAQAEIGARAAAEQWEKIVGWDPFYVPEGAPAKTRRFDGPDADGVLYFRKGAQRIDSIQVGPTTLQPERDYLLLGSNDIADYAEEPPFCAVRFLTARFGTVLPGQCKITAQWGYTTKIPGYAWQQILQAAGLVALTSIENLQSIASLSVDGLSKAWDVVGIITQKDLLVTWAKDFWKAATLYTRGSAQ